jgi:peptidoglycan-N-acetylglucosamine deacetylase
VLIVASPSPTAAGAVLVSHGSRDRPWVALTFDADITQAMLAALRAHRVAAWYDPRLIATLQASDTPATIFLTGLWAQTYPEVVRSLALDPRFELENHSLDHAAFRAPCYRLPGLRNDATRWAEVIDAARVIAALTGRVPRYFRFPGGCYAPSDLALVAALGETPVGWDVVSGDAFQRDARVIVARVLAQVRPGSIIVLHLVGAPNAPATEAALRIIIPELRARGYRFVTLAQLLGETTRTRSHRQLP